MSYSETEHAVWQMKKPRRAEDRLALVAMATYCNNDHECWPSADAIAANMASSTRAAREAMVRLEADGHIRRTGELRAKGAIVWKLVLDEAERVPLAILPEEPGAVKPRPAPTPIVQPAPAVIEPPEEEEERSWRDDLYDKWDVLRQKFDIEPREFLTDIWVDHVRDSPSIAALVAKCSGPGMYLPDAAALFEFIRQGMEPAANGSRPYQSTLKVDLDSDTPMTWRKAKEHEVYSG